MDRFCYENFYAIQTAVGVISIGLIVGNCVYWSKKSERMHKVINEAVKANRLTFDWSSANKQANALQSKMKR